MPKIQTIDFEKVAELRKAHLDENSAEFKKRFSDLTTDREISEERWDRIQEVGRRILKELSDRKV